MKFSRRASTQDISWFLDQDRLGRLDLSPPYQRKSVWTAGDRRFFLDTIFRGFPCPPVYLHKSIDTSGTAVFHVVDGKQRIDTILLFAKENKIRIPSDYGDDRLSGKRWKDILADRDLRNTFLNYSIIVEFFDDVDSSLVNEVFARMNKNSKKLTRQEVRNARFEGWFSSQVENEVDDTIWKDFGVVTPGRARRMADAQLISELFIVLIRRSISGFDQDAIDQFYADHDDVSNLDLNLDEENFISRRDTAKRYLLSMKDADPNVTEYASTSANVYTLWAFIVLNSESLPSASDGAKRYVAFMEALAVHAATASAGPDEASADEEVPLSKRRVIKYYTNNQSATTEFPQRSARLQALSEALHDENRPES